MVTRRNFIKAVVAIAVAPVAMLKAKEELDVYPFIITPTGTYAAKSISVADIRAAAKTLEKNRVHSPFILAVHPDTLSEVQALNGGRFNIISTRAYGRI